MKESRRISITQTPRPRNEEEGEEPNASGDDESESVTKLMGPTTMVVSMGAVTMIASMESARKVLMGQLTKDDVERDRDCTLTTIPTMRTLVARQNPQ